MEQQTPDILFSIDKRMVMIENYLGRIAWALEDIAQKGNPDFKTQEEKRQARAKALPQNPSTQH